jgi:hypothetical protein
MHACVPQVCVAYPEYVNVNKTFEISWLVADTEIDTIATALNRLLEDKALHHRLKTNCILARETYCWQQQEKTLINFYKKLLG